MKTLKVTDQQLAIIHQLLHSGQCALAPDIVALQKQTQEALEQPNKSDIRVVGTRKNA